MRKYFELRNPTIGQAVKYAEAGDTDAMIAMARYGRMPEYGIVPKTDTDEQEAIYWFTKAAELGSIQAMRGIADMYDGFNNLTDPPEKTDYDLAEHWYTEAIRHGCKYSYISILEMKAKQGDSYSMLCLAHEEDKGQGCPQYWYEKAAELGEPEACHWMYSLYIKWNQKENAEKYRKMANPPIIILKETPAEQLPPKPQQPTQPSLF